MVLLIHNYEGYFLKAETHDSHSITNLKKKTRELFQTGSIKS